MIPAFCKFCTSRLDEHERGHCHRAVCVGRERLSVQTAARREHELCYVAMDCAGRADYRAGVDAKTGDLPTLGGFHVVPKRKARFVSLKGLSREQLDQLDITHANALDKTSGPLQRDGRVAAPPPSQPAPVQEPEEAGASQPEIRYSCGRCGWLGVGAVWDVVSKVHRCERCSHTAYAWSVPHPAEEKCWGVWLPALRDWLASLQTPPHPAVVGPLSQAEAEERLRLLRAPDAEPHVVSCAKGAFVARRDPANPDAPPTDAPPEQRELRVGDRFRLLPAAAEVLRSQGYGRDVVANRMAATLVVKSVGEYVVAVDGWAFLPKYLELVEEGS